jgi:Acyl-CoA thioester hydrolase/BAAT N-terminal region
MTHPTPFPQSHILVNPTTPMLDTPFQIRLVDFPPQHPLTLRMTMHDEIGTWSAHATFLTDEHGTVDLQSQEPIAANPSHIFPTLCPRS